MKLIRAEHSEKSQGHYSPGVISGRLLFVSGQLSVHPKTGKRPEGGIQEETLQALINLETVLKAAGIDRTNVVQCRVYVPDVAYWPEVNDVYSAFFKDHKPARVIVPTNKLHSGCLVEIEAIAEMDEEVR